MVLQQLRRHGDIIQRTVGGYYIVQGRADDTMNLGGIKVEPPLFNVTNPLLPSFIFMKPNQHCSHPVSADKFSRDRKSMQQSR
jgi:hypothetical protein